MNYHKFNVTTQPNFDSSYRFNGRY